MPYHGNKVERRHDRGFQTRHSIKRYGGGTWYNSTTILSDRWIEFPSPPVDSLRGPTHHSRAAALSRPPPGTSPHPFTPKQSVVFTPNNLDTSYRYLYWSQYRACFPRLAALDLVRRTPSTVVPSHNKIPGRRRQFVHACDHESRPRPDARSRPGPRPAATATSVGRLWSAAGPATSPIPASTDSTAHRLKR